MTPFKFTVTMEVEGLAPEGMSNEDILEAVQQTATWGTLDTGNEGVVFPSVVNGVVFIDCNEPEIELED